MLFRSWCSLYRGSPGDKGWPAGHYAHIVHDLTTGVLSALLHMSPLVLLSCHWHCSHGTYAIIFILFLRSQSATVPGTSQRRPSTWILVKGEWRCWILDAGSGSVEMLVLEALEWPATKLEKCWLVRVEDNSSQSELTQPRSSRDVGLRSSCGGRGPRWRQVAVARPNRIEEDSGQPEQESTLARSENKIWPARDLDMSVCRVKGNLGLAVTRQGNLAQSRPIRGEVTPACSETAVDSVQPR